MSASYNQDEANALLGKRVVVNSYRLSDKVGTIEKYIREKHQFIVCMDDMYKTKKGHMSRWHFCNAGNCVELIKEVEK